MTRLYDAFEKVARRHLQRIALVDSDTSYTYEQALERIALLAAQVAQPRKEAALIIGSKNADTVLWQLACNAAGQVFIPCDAATPASRLENIIERMGPRWVLTDIDRGLVEYGYSQTSILGKFQLWTREPARQFAPEISHVIFSSGSTGTPKAILLPDTSVVSVTRTQAAQVGAGPDARFAWLLSPAFDASLSDIYLTLLSGGTLHVCEFSMRSLKTLQAYFLAQGITHSDLSPSVLPLLSPEALPALQAVVFGGELAKESVIFDWVSKGKRLFNAYGPTETTICSSLREVTPGWTATNIGKPLLGTTYWLRQDDTFWQGLPGDRGELYISGDHLAIGYDDEALTAGRFLHHEGQVYYKTGDVVELDHAGEYHFRGRVDRQMKYHGVLICPEEVEAQALHAGCQEALLRLEDKKLVLYYAGEVQESTLKGALKAYVVPQALPHKYVQMKALPKSIAGKIQL